MSEIPEDIMRAAHKAIDDARSSVSPMVTIARAILAERERWHEVVSRLRSRVRARALTDAEIEEEMASAERSFENRESNIQVLCTACHGAKTAGDVAEKSRGYRKTPLSRAENPDRPRQQTVTSPIQRIRGNDSDAHDSYRVEPSDRLQTVKNGADKQKHDQRSADVRCELQAVVDPASKPLPEFQRTKR